MLKEAYYMEQSFLETKPQKTEQMAQGQEICYEHAGYQVRLHFSGKKTLVQCIKNLAKRKIEG